MKKAAVLLLFLEDGAEYDIWSQNRRTEKGQRAEPRMQGVEEGTSGG